MIYVYTQPGCAPCKRAISRLEESSVEFEVIDIAEPINERIGEQIKNLGATGTPVFERFVDSDYSEFETEWFQGYDKYGVDKLEKWISEETPNYTDDGIWLD